MFLNVSTTYGHVIGYYYFTPYLRLLWKINNQFCNTERVLTTEVSCFFNLHTHLLHNTTCMYLRNCCTCVFVWKIGEFICKCSEKDKSQIFSQITIHHLLLSSSYPSGGSKEPLLAALSIARVVPKYPKMFRYVGIGQTLYNRPLPGCIVGGWYGHWPYICLHFSVESIKVRISFWIKYI